MRATCAAAWHNEITASYRRTRRLGHEELSTNANRGVRRHRWKEEERAMGHVMTDAAWGCRNASSLPTRPRAVRIAVLALTFAASCATGTSQNASGTGLTDASAPGADGGSEAPESDGPVANASDASNDPDGDAWSGGPHQGAAPGVDLDATNLDAPGPDPVPVACSADASEAGSCPLPRSVCADGRWLVFYDNPLCLADSCTWEKRYLDCGNLGCFVGQCRPPFTL